jgi:tetratricopeptide (TPR) repeat protein
MLSPKVISVILLAFFKLFAFGQSNQEWLERGLIAKKENRIDDAFLCFQQLLRSDSNIVVYLCNASIFYCKKGNEFEDVKTRYDYFNTALYLANRSLLLDSNDAEAHYSKALALGRINEFAATKIKIAHAKEIKYHIDETLRINPAHAGAYHLLGRWNRSIANFGSVEKMMINNLYGGVPKGATFEGALEAFIKAVAFEPKYKLHQYELACTYLAMGKPVNAKIWFEKTIKINALSANDKSIDKKCLQALAEIK